MSARINYARHAAHLADWISEIGQTVPDANPGDVAIDYIANQLASGKSVEEFLKEEGLHWPILSAWIKKDDGRRRRYEEALRDRKFLRHERLLDGWWKTATIEVVEYAGHIDVQRARESLAKAEGLFRQAEGGVKGSVTITFDEVDAKA